MSLHDGRGGQAVGRIWRLQEDSGQRPRHHVEIVTRRLEEAHAWQEVVRVRRHQGIRIVSDSSQQWLQPADVDHDVTADEHENWPGGKLRRLEAWGGRTFELQI